MKELIEQAERELSEVHRSQKAPVTTTLVAIAKLQAEKLAELEAKIAALQTPATA